MFKWDCVSVPVHAKTTTNISGPTKPNGLKFYTAIKFASHGSVTEFYENCLKADSVINM